MKSIYTKNNFFPYPYKGGELWYCNLSGLKSDQEAFFLKLKEQEAFVRKHNNTSRILLHLYDTKITYDMAKRLLESLKGSEHYTYMLAIVGITKIGEFYLKLLMRLTGQKLEKPTKFYFEIDRAKDWLVGKDSSHSNY